MMLPAIGGSPQLIAVASLKHEQVANQSPVFRGSPQLIAVASLKPVALREDSAHGLRSPQLIAVASLKHGLVADGEAGAQMISTANRCGLVEARESSPRKAHTIPDLHS